MIHVLVDSYGCSTQRLDNLMDVYEVLNKIVNTMRLESVMPPQLIPYYYCENLEDVGISAYVLIRGGHLTIHTFPQLGCYFLDLLYDGFVSGDLLEKLLKKEFPCDAFFIKRIDRNEFKKNDMGMYDVADFGPHYMISTVLNHVPTLDEFSDKLDRLPYEVDMHPISRPCVLKDRVDAPRFLSGIVLIAESHIAMHYNYETREVLMDIFSCKNIDSAKYNEVMKTMFDAPFTDVLILRGRKHEQRQNTQVNKYYAHKNWQDNLR